LICNTRIITVENIKDGCLTFRHQFSKELLLSVGIWHFKRDHFDHFWPISVPALIVVVLLIATVDVVVLVDETNKVNLILQCKYYVRL